MKRVIIFFFLLFIGGTSSAQNLYLKISGKTELENKIIDSVNYSRQHLNVKSVIDETNQFSEKLIKLGYIENEVFKSEKINDSTFFFTFHLKKRTDFIHIYIGKANVLKSLAILDTPKDTLTLRFSETENFLNQTLNKLEQIGYSLAKLKLINFSQNNNSLVAELFLDTGKLRQLNDIVINGYDKFPEGHKRNIKRLYKNKTFNQENLEKIYSDFNKFRFVNQTKYPEILFTKDTTKVFVYLEKAKPNKFDGFIGFSNDEKSKIAFNGYLDLLLVNTLNAGEEFSLYWKSDGNDQKTFNIGIEVPYISKSPFGVKASLTIFKQDSTFQNTKTALDIGYYFNYNTRLYLGYQATESSDIQNQNNFNINDYSNSFITLDFEFLDFKKENFLFPEKTNFKFKFGIGDRNSNLSTNKQLFADIDLRHTLYLNEKNSIHIRSQNFYLQSNQYIISELFRFGGINSIRGFNENSLQANLFTSLLTEYRYVFAPNLYMHSIIDYGYYKDQSNANSGSLLGLGIGFGLLTKNGLLNIVYANGSTKEQAIKLSNSIVHLSFKTNF